MSKTNLLMAWTALVAAAIACGQPDPAELGADGGWGVPRVIVPAPKNARHQHLSWPKIVKAGDGTWVVAYIAGRKHVNGDGCPAVSLSTDEGQTFSEPNILMNFDASMPYQHCANLAMGVAPHGAVVLMGMAFTDNLRNAILGWRSEDGGRTWRLTDTSALSDSKTGSVFGHVFPVAGKGLAVCGHYRKPKGDGIWIAYSADQGRSWGHAQTITDARHFEPVFIYTGGKLAGLVREDAAHAYHQLVSGDLGQTWQFTRNAIQGNPQAGHPSPFLAEDPSDSGTLYALQTERTRAKEIYLWSARNDSFEWKRMGRVAAAPDAEDFGYPWMMPVKGHDWFLVFYAGQKDGPNAIYGAKIRLPW